MTTISTFRTCHVTPRVHRDNPQGQVTGFHFAFYENCELFAVGDIDNVDVELERILKEWMYEGSIPSWANINEVKD